MHTSNSLHALLLSTATYFLFSQIWSQYNQRAEKFPQNSESEESDEADSDLEDVGQDSGEENLDLMQTPEEMRSPQLSAREVVEAVTAAEQSLVSADISKCLWVAELIDACLECLFLLLFFLWKVKLF